MTTAFATNAFPLRVLGHNISAGWSTLFEFQSAGTLDVMKPRTLSSSLALAGEINVPVAFGAEQGFISYPGITGGLAAEVVYQSPGFGPTVDSSNDGDWRPAFSGVPFDPLNGVIIPASYPVYGSDDVGASGSPGRGFIEVPGRFTDVSPAVGFADGWLSVTDISTAGSEVNFDLGIVYFPYSEGWIGGSVSTGGFILAGNTTGVDLARDFDPGRFTLSIAGVNSLTSGMLFTVGGDNSNSANVVATETRPDGSGLDISYDQGGTFTDSDGDAESNGGQDGTFHFVYVPYTAENLTGGRIDDDGTILNLAGSFFGTRVDLGTYVLQIPDGLGGFLDDSDGLIIANVSKGASLGGGIAVDPDDNYIEFLYSAASLGWEVRAFDLPGGNLEDTEFVFALSPYVRPISIPEPSAFASGMLALGLLSSHRVR